MATVEYKPPSLPVVSLEGGYGWCICFGLQNLWEKAHFSDVGIVRIIRQRLEDIELQSWFSEMHFIYLGAHA